MSRETMSNATRQELLEVLEALMMEHPDWRVGQLVANIAFLARQINTATWDVENEEFIEAARQHLQRMTERNQALRQAKEQIAEQIVALRQKTAA